MARARARWTTRAALALALLALSAPRRASSADARGESTRRVGDSRARGRPLVVVSLDGVVRALDADTGDNVWAFDSGGALAGASWTSAGEDARALTPRSAASGTRTRNVFPGVDGALYAHHVDQDAKHVVRRLPVTTRELVEASPSATRDGALVVGRRSSTIYALRASTGALVRSVDVDGTITSVMGGDAMNGADEELIYVGRTEYVVRSVDAETGEERWNVTHGELRSLSRDSDTGALRIGTDRASDAGSLVIGPGNVVRSVDEETGEIKWSKRMASLPLGVSDASGRVIVENAAQIPAESDDKIIVGTHERGLFALPYTASAGEGLRDGSDSSNALVAASESEDFVRVDIGSDEDDWSCIPEDLVKATLDKTSSRLPGSRTSRRALNVLLVGGLSIVFVYLTQLKRRNIEVHDVNAPSSVVTGVEDAEQEHQRTAAAKKRAKKRAKQAEARAAEAELAAKIQEVMEEKTREETRVGRLLIKPSVLGYGSCGTIVFEGELDGRRVAVKRLLAQFHELARKELQALIASDEHPNILRCFALEEDSNFVYMALELCASSLARVVDPVGAANESESSAAETNAKALNIKCIDEATKYPTAECLRILHDVVAGLAALHEQGIIHRDLKPQNVLITSSGRGKIADMGLAKRVNVSEGTSFYTHTNGNLNTNDAAGTSGWQAPERLTQGRQSRSVDVFSLGCLMYYCLTGGAHPFGERLQRDANVVANSYDVSELKYFPEAEALVKACIDADPSKRPSATEILAHPMWWDAEKKLQFLIDASDRVELEDRMSDRSLLRAFETRAKSSIACDDWTKKLDAALLENLGRYREYDGTSLRDLLRVIRNKANHYRELPPKLQRTLGSYPDGLWRYVSIRFPALLLGVRDFFAPSAAREPTLAKYFLSIEAASKASFAPPLARAESIPDKPLIAPQVFPSRPGREPCEFYMKTGRCKFGATCKFDHPQGVHWDVHNER